MNDGRERHSPDGADTLEAYLSDPDALDQSGTFQGSARLENLVQRHAPRNWRDSLSPTQVRELVEDGRPMEMIAMAVDIRKSTLIMKEQIDFKQFAGILSEFVTSSARLIRWSGGWFDKFTGDGLLAYWIFPDGDWEPFAERPLNVCRHMLANFQKTAFPALKRNARNLPAGVGLSVGIDAGPTHLVKVAGDLTVVGSSVVGATRMVDTAAGPWETVCNVHFGEPLYQQRERLRDELGIEVTKSVGATKEYEAQEAYAIHFPEIA